MPDLGIICGEVAFSVNCFRAPYSSIWIQFGEVHLDPCAFAYSKFDDDWVKLTLLLGVKLMGYFTDSEPAFYHYKIAIII